MNKLIVLFTFITHLTFAQQTPTIRVLSNDPIEKRTIENYKDVDYKHALSTDLYLPFFGAVMLNYERVVIPKRVIAEIGLGATLYPNGFFEEITTPFEDEDVTWGDERTTTPKLAYEAKVKYFLFPLDDYSGWYLATGFQNRKYKFTTDDQFQYDVGYSMFDWQITTGLQGISGWHFRMYCDLYLGMAFRDVEQTAIPDYYSYQKLETVTLQKNINSFVAGVKIGIPFY